MSGLHFRRHMPRNWNSGIPCDQHRRSRLPASRFLHLTTWRSGRLCAKSTGLMGPRCALNRSYCPFFRLTCI
ncbi:hypothetical protein PAXRUDRAFT_746108 [Paxillus rubicundulus Ve08.2h10]|uniref:Uncharacterized protein n=1 Tax=Paxillus rubicundulus Ve08.2h10 TaxID=930991 RepID=A0A0D0DI14_9AGAM|nr:hypothetical protein PAXRUDRAFT_746108 [Paxillus rubicundulus Ve08.2h10]